MSYYDDRTNFPCYIDTIPLMCVVVHNPDTGENKIEGAYLAEYFRNPSILSLLSTKVKAQILAKFAERKNK